MRRIATVPASGLVLDRQASTPLYRQLYDQLRTAILSGQFTGQTRLPATRTLAAELGIARRTVLLAYEQLRAEGYLESQVGAGTRVALTLPEVLLQAAMLHSPPDHGASASAAHTRDAASPPAPLVSVLSQRGSALRSLHETEAPFAPLGQTIVSPAFRLGVPALGAFPRGVWGRLMAQSARRIEVDHLQYHDLAGYRPLRQAIAAYVGMARGVPCTAEQVFVTVGAQGALDSIARMLLNQGNPVWMEDPGYPGAYGALVAAGARIIPLPVDAQGIAVEVGQRVAPDARLVYVTPAHQFPLGTTMSIARRLALLEWAHRTGAWIIEDDYDSEYHYRRPPVPALYGMEAPGHEQVIYVGTFSKVLFPALRLGYVIAPTFLVEALQAAARFTVIHPPWTDQRVLTDFMNAGHFGRHIRRMRTLYASRAATLYRALRQELPAMVRVQRPAGGLHLNVWLPPEYDDRQIQAQALQQGIETTALSWFRLPETAFDSSTTLLPPGLVLGFADVPDLQIRAGVRNLAEILVKPR